MSKRVCQNSECRGKIKNPRSMHQTFCNDCHDKGGKIKMNNVQKEYNEGVDEQVKEDEKNSTQSVKEEVKEDVKEEVKEDKVKTTTSTHINCSVCSNKKYCSIQRFEKLVKKIGSEEEVRNAYVCRDCKKKE